MYVPVPVLIIGTLLVLGLLVWALMRGSNNANRDLIGPPRTEPAIRHGQDRPAGSPSFAAPPSVAASDGGAVELPDDLREEVWRLVHTGHVVNAVKLVRDRTGLSLRESKDLVDSLRQSDVTLR